MSGIDEKPVNILRQALIARMKLSSDEVKNRHSDSHDVLANFQLSNDFLTMSNTPNNVKDFLLILQERHAMLMSERPDIQPGKFKDTMNKAGNTYFVAPQDVIGTLTHAFDIYQMQEDGFKKALFMHFMLTEIHPFNDGNGRLSRVMLNAELVKVQDYKIIIPTVYRDSYLSALRSLSRDHILQTYCKVMDAAQAYTASIPWLDYSAARVKIEHDHAERDADEGLGYFNSALRKIDLSDLTL